LLADVEIIGKRRTDVKFILSNICVDTVLV